MANLESMKGLNYIQGTDEDDIITVLPNTKVSIDAGNGNDIIYVQGGTVSSLTMNSGNNKLILNSDAVRGGTITKLTTGSGTDVIEITKGTLSNLYGDAGVDELIFNGGTLTNGLFGAGADNLTVNGGVLAKANMGADNDIVTINGGTITTLLLDSGENSVILHDGLVKTLTAGTDKDEIRIEANAKINTIKANATIASQELITVAGGILKTATLGAGDDNLTVINGTVTNVNMGSGNDYVLLKDGTITTLRLSSGENTLNMEGGYIKTLYAGTDINHINLKDGKIGKYVGSTGAEIITLAGMEKANLNTGAGNDQLYVNAGSEHILAGGAGEDLLVVNGGNNLTLNGGTGNDSYVINYLETDGNYIINNATAGKADIDTLDLSSFASTEFTYAVDSKGNMLLTHTDGATITVKGWNTRPMGISFKDEYFDVLAMNAKIEKTINVKAAGSGKGTKYKDTFVIAPAKTVKATISNYSKYDMIDLSAFNNISLYVDYAKDGMLLRIYDEENWSLKGYVKLKNYYYATSPLTEILMPNNERWQIVQVPYENSWYYDVVNLSNETTEEDGEYDLSPDITKVTISENAKNIVLTNCQNVTTLDLRDSNDTIVVAKYNDQDTILEFLNRSTGQLQKTVTLKDYLGDVENKNLKIVDAYGTQTSISAAHGNNVYALGDGLIYEQDANMPVDNIYGSEHWDSITLHGPVGTVNTYGDNDSIEVDGAIGTTINTGDGDDYLSIKDGKDLTVNMGAGANDIYITNGENISAKLESGLASINIYGGQQINITTGNDRANVYIDKYPETSENIANHINITTGSAADDITISNGSDIKIDAGDGENTFTIRGGNDLELHAGNDSDTFDINTSNTNITIYETAGNNTYSIKAPESNITIYDGIGNDDYSIYNNLNTNIVIDNLAANNTNANTLSIWYSDWEDFKFSYDPEKDTVLLKDTAHSFSVTYKNFSQAPIEKLQVGSTVVDTDILTQNHSFMATEAFDVINGTEYDDEIIVATNIDNTILLGNAGDDTLIASAGNNHYLNGGTGDDILKVTGGRNHQLQGGSGNDSYVICSSLKEDSDIIIIQRKEDYYSYFDTLTFCVEDITNTKCAMTVTDTYGTSVLRIYSEGDKGQIFVTDWNTQALSTISILDANTDKCYFYKKNDLQYALNSMESAALSFTDSIFNYDITSLSTTEEEYLAEFKLAISNK